MIELLNITDGEDKSSPLKNRIRKNYKHLKKWAKRSETNCFRIYDRDIKEYPLAIDYYDGRFCVHLFTFDQDPEDKLELLSKEVSSTLHSLFGIDEDMIFFRHRIKREKLEQYEKKDDLKDSFIVLEHGVKFLINLKSYLDTGLFLDHRETRQLVAKNCRDKRLLNLFSYTCSFSVQAATHGALSTKSVDMSNTYSDWGRRNFIINHIPEKNNPIIREDVFEFLKDELSTHHKYDIIIIDPPTISRSKKMEKMLDVQRDYIFLIHEALKLLSSNGVIYFSTNLRKFQFNEDSFSECMCENITEKTIPMDFHDKKIHKCWKIKKK